MLTLDGSFVKENLEFSDFSFVISNYTTMNILKLFELFFVRFFKLKQVLFELVLLVR
jgi:hypothetical protein